MLIITDEIRNTEFLKPMKSEAMKHYIENYALASLRYCFRDKYDDWLLLDSPDLQSPDHQCGIEVTEIVVKGKNEIDSQWQKYRETGDKKHIDVGIKLGATFDDTTCSYPVVNSKDELSALETVFSKKIHKLQKYRDNGYREVGLILVMNDIAIPNTALQWYKRVLEIQKTKPTQFDVVFFLHSCDLSWIGNNEHEPHYIHIPNKDGDALRKYARIQAEYSS